jgi:hypothetical protein
MLAKSSDLANVLMKGRRIAGANNKLVDNALGISDES